MKTAFLFSLFAAHSATALRRGSLMMKAAPKVVSGHVNLYSPKTPSQTLYHQHLQNAEVNIVICAGPAGSGKTALACQYAIEKYKQGLFKKIVITRPLVTVEEDIGFLPGNLNKKMEPWTRPMMDIFNEHYPMSVLNNMINENIIEISPLGFMRGRTFKDSIIIADEMQNSSPNQMLMIMTRIGDNSKLVVTGDLKQTDTHDSGLKDILYKYKRFSSTLHITDCIKVVELSNEDIMRHPVVSKVLDLYAGGEVAAAKATAAVATAVATAVAKSTAVLSGADDCALIPSSEYDKTLRGRSGTTENWFGDQCYIADVDRA
jgi:phosphate starvation-inducible PhoH-like protein